MALAACLGLSVVAPATAQADAAPTDEIAPFFLRIAAGPPGGVYFPVAGLIANAVTRAPGAPACVPGGPCGAENLVAIVDTSAGSVANVAALRAGDADAALLQADVAAWAHEGSLMFAKAGPYADLRALAALHREALHVIVNALSPVTMLAELDGGRLAIGSEGSGTRAAVSVILDAAGVTPGERVAFAGGLPQALAALGRGEIDAAFFFGGAPAPALQGLAPTRPFRLLPVQGEAIAARIQETTYYLPTTIAAGAYGDAFPETPTIGVSALLAVDRALDPALVDNMLTALWRSENRVILDGGHPAGRSIQRAGALHGVPIPVHAAAAAYYRRETGEEE